MATGLLKKVILRKKIMITLIINTIVNSRINGLLKNLYILLIFNNIFTSYIRKNIYIDNIYAT